MGNTTSNTDWRMLPCKMPGTVSLIDTKIISTAIDRGNYIFTHKALRREHISEFLSRVCGSPPYIMDCSIYMQLISQCDNEGYLIRDKVILSIAVDVRSTIMLRRIKSPNAGYIKVDNDMVHSILQQMELPCKGEWVIRLDKQNSRGEPLFLGLITDGPVMWTFDKWVNHLSKMLREKKCGKLIEGQEWTIQW